MSKGRRSRKDVMSSRKDLSKNPYEARVKGSRRKGNQDVRNDINIGLVFQTSSKAGDNPSQM
jgi:hypothetical protein